MYLVMTVTVRRTWMTYVRIAYKAQVKQLIEEGQSTNVTVNVNTRSKTYEESSRTT